MSLVERRIACLPPGQSIAVPHRTPLFALLGQRWLMSYYCSHAYRAERRRFFPAPGHNDCLAMLIPREHGVYGQLGFSMAAAIAAGTPSIASLLLTAGLVAAFLAHESLLVLLGARGPRALREQRTIAIRDGACLGAIAIAGLSVGTAMMRAEDRWVIAVPVLCAAVVFLLVFKRLEKTTAGEMFVALACASCALPVAAAAGLPTRAAVLISLVMATGYLAATAAVRGTIALQRREPHAALRAGGALLALAAGPIVFILARRLGLQPALWVATLPLSALSFALAVAPPSARYLRRVGWALIAASALATVLWAVLMRK
jgi:YwiC-like protein